MQVMPSLTEVISSSVITGTTVQPL